MSRRILFRLFIIGLAILVLVSLATAFAAGITVPDTHIGIRTFPITANDLKPSQCVSLNLTNVVTGSGIITGTAGNDLILGSAGIDSIDGLGGNDCIVGEASDDTIDGGDGNDVCLGGPGNDSFSNCETTVQ